MAKIDWQRSKHLGRAREPAVPPPPAKKGCGSHIKREPVRVYTAAEIAAWTPTQLKTRTNVKASPTDEVLKLRAGITDLVAKACPTFAITLAFHRDTTPADAIRKTRLLHAMLERAALGTAWLKRVDERSSYIAVIEHVDTNLHVHLALTSGDKHRACIETAIKIAWKKLVCSGTVKLKPVFDAAGWGSYMAKEITPDTADHLFISEGTSRPT